MGRWPNKYVIGLTGNIAVGKSVVRQMLQHLGAYTIDADALTHQAMAPGAPAYKPVIEMFGRFVVQDDGRINRGILGHIAFTYPEAMEKLEAIVHPVVVQATHTLITRAKQRVVVVEAIKLIESSLGNAVDAVWVVDAPPEAQLERLMSKRNLSEAEARQRIASQRAQSEKLSRADVIISNGGSVDETWRQVQAAWADVRRALDAPLVTGELRPVVLPTDTTAPAAPPRPAQTGAQPSRPAMTIHVRRGMPGNAELIANFMSQITGRPIDRMDVMMAFGQKSYLLAQDDENHVLALLGWQVENLITRVDEFYMAPGAPHGPVVRALLGAVEDASKELQSEVGFIFLPATTSEDTVQSFHHIGYDTTTLADIRVPAWREAVHEMVSGNPRILTKKLRADRVMKPI